VSWPIYKIGEICHKVTDGSHNPPKGIENSNYLMLSSKNIYNDEITFTNPRFLTKDDFIKENKRTDVSPGDVLLTIVGTVGRVAVVPECSEKFTLQRSVAVLKPESKKIDSRYLMYSLQSKTNILNQGAKGVAQKGIYLKSIKELDIDIPPLKEQKRIAAILDKADAIRRKRQQAIKLADEFLKSVFLDMFGDPVINPKGWDVGVFSDISILNPKAEKYDDSLEVSFVPMRNVSEVSEKLDVSDIRSYSEVKKGFTSFVEGDVLFAKITPCMENGKAAIATGLKNGVGFGSTEFHVFRPNESYYKEFIYSLIHLENFRLIAANNFSGAVGHKRVPKGFLAGYKLYLPPVSLVEKYSNIFNVVKSNILAMERSVNEKEVMFKSLSQKAFAGEL